MNTEHDIKKAINNLIQEVQLEDLDDYHLNKHIKIFSKRVIELLNEYIDEIEDKDKVIKESQKFLISMHEKTFKMIKEAQENFESHKNPDILKEEKVKIIIYTKNEIIEFLENISPRIANILKKEFNLD